MKVNVHFMAALAVSCIVAASITNRSAFAQEGKDPAKPVMPFSFKWAFIQKSSGVEKVLDFKETPAVKAGDELRIFFQPVSNAYIYLYMFDTQKNLTFVFPKTPSDFENEYMPGSQYFLPSRNTWFKMDDSKGTERFYLLASSRRLDKLEKLTTELLNASDKSEAKARVIEEIMDQQKQHSTLSAPAEKSVAIAGSVVTITRGAENPPANPDAPMIMGTLVEGDTFYSKTLRLTHE